ncbi:T9SS type A sorting domain-containing protein [bacterium]|nr:T9SS type A sorting domain-containing protein [bacterium]
MLKRVILSVLVLVLAFGLFAQTKSIGIWVEFVDYDGEYENILSALDSAPFDYELHEYWHYDSITTDSLNQIDVFITPELESSGGSSMDTTAGAFLGPILQTWVSGGGLMINFYQHGADFLTCAGFDTVALPNSSTYHDSIDVILPGHPIAEGVDARFYGMSASYAYGTYSGYTPVATVTEGGIVYMHTGFQEFGAGCVCYMGWDYFEATTPNQDLLFQNAISYWGMRSEGPILREFSPIEGNVVTGYPTIRMEFQDEDGVDFTSLQFYLNGSIYTGYDSMVSAIGDTVFVDIPDTMPDGEVTFQIRSIEDVLGHEGPDTARVFSFYLDNTPPQLSYREPEGIMTYMPDGAMIKYSDEIAGTSVDNWYMFFPGLDTIRTSTSGVIVEDDTLVLFAFALIHLYPTPDDTNWLEFGVWDTPDEGEPNIERYRWWFMPTVGIKEHLPESMEFVAYPNPFNSAVRISVGEGLAPSRVEIFDIAGRRIDVLSSATKNPLQYEGDLSPSGRDNNRKEFTWQPSENIGSGVYLVRVRHGDQALLKRIAYLK